MTFAAQQSRVDALIRLTGLIVVIFGVLWLLYTYSDASGVASEIVTINYFLGLLLLIVGLFAAFAKFK
jgi:membrane-bound ClpP family serine protease